MGSVYCVAPFCESGETTKMCGVCFARHCALHKKLGFQCMECDKWCCMSCVSKPVDAYICKGCKNKKK